MRNKLVLLVFCVLFVSNSKAQQIQIEERFESAYKEIVAMLEDKKALSIKRSVFLAEWAYLDGNLDYESDFCQPIRKGADYMKRMIVANRWENYKTAKQIALCNYFFYPCSGNGQNPFRYDFSKEYSEEDWQHQLVSGTLKTHKGQCHSLPMGFQAVCRRTWSKGLYSTCPTPLLHYVQR